MATTRLVNRIRDSILADLMNHAFKEQCETQMAEETAFAYEMFDTVFPLFDEKVSSLPAHFFPLDDDFKVQFGDDMQSLYFGTGFDHWTNWCRGVDAKADRVKRRMPHSAYAGGCCKSFASDHAATLKFKELKAKREVLVEAMDEARRTARATLASVTTIAKLIDVWPECRLFAEAYEVQGIQKAILPAIPRAELNNALNLAPASGTQVRAGGAVIVAGDDEVAGGTVVS